MYPSRIARRTQRDFIHGVPGAIVPQGVPRDDARVPTLVARDAPDRAAGVRDAWLRWLAPRFPNGSLYFTGTYSDEYGIAHGCMAPRNVHKDFRRWLLEQGLEGREFINGVEQHQYRDVLHLHAVVGGEYSDLDRRLLAASWAAERGHARALPVLDGCASYVTKYALKGSTQSFDWNLAP